MKTIFHVDMDAFFVSVEELFDPSLKGKPVVVGGRAGERGVVSAASYAARKFGVHSAMPLREAYERCPSAIFLEGHPARYRDHSHKVFQVFRRFTPLVEMASIDEAYLDLTGTSRIHGPPLKAAHALHELMKERTGLNCSIGISTSRLVSKVCSDQAKPNGMLWVLPGQEASFLAPLDVRRIPGVGKVTGKNLNALGIQKVGDLTALDEEFLRQRFGKWGLALAGKARGLDAGAWFDAEIGSHEKPKSVSHEHTFSTDTDNREALESMTTRLTEMVARRLREHELYARTVQIKLRYSDFSTFTRAHTMDQATQLDTELLRHVHWLFHKHWTGKPIRLIGVHTSSFEPSEGQLNLLDSEHHERWKKALDAVDRMRDRFGETSVSLAGGLKGEFRERTHENPAGLPGRRASDAAETGSDDEPR